MIARIAPSAAERLRLRTQAGVANDREPRRTVELTGFAALGDGTTFAISVLDLSCDGCKITTPAVLLPGVCLVLTIQGIRGAIEAVVKWCREDYAGLRFNPEQEQSLAPVQKPRQFERVQLAAAISLRRPGRPGYTVRLFDLAPTGCKIEFVERSRTEERIWVKFDGLEAVEAIVRWVDGFYGGVEFTRPIYPAVFQLLLRRLQHGCGR